MTNMINMINFSDDYSQEHANCDDHLRFYLLSFR